MYCVESTIISCICTHFFNKFLCMTFLFHFFKLLTSFSSLIHHCVHFFLAAFLTNGWDLRRSSYFHYIFRSSFVMMKSPVRAWNVIMIDAVTHPPCRVSSVVQVFHGNNSLTHTKQILFKYAQKSKIRSGFQTVPVKNILKHPHVYVLKRKIP